MAEGPTIPEPVPPADPPPAAPADAAPPWARPSTAPPPRSPGGWNDPRGRYDRDGPKKVRWGPVVVFGGLFLVLLGVLIAIFLVPSTPPRPAVVSVVLWNYGSPALPPNPWARNDGGRLDACFPEDPKDPKARARRQEILETPDALRSFVADLKNQPEDRTFVCYLTALADEVDGVTLLAPVAGAGTGVPLRDLLDGMAACRAERKLLVLDVAHPMTRPVTGPFHTDPATALDDALSAYGDLPCPVLVSCSRGETSLPMDPERHSAFLYYLAEGITGAADGADEEHPGRDKTVTVRELYRFTAARTNRWAMRVYDRKQTPRLYVGGVRTADFDAFYPVAYPAGPFTSTPNSRPKELADAWAQRDGRLADRTKYHPLALAAYEGVLLRAEAYWRAGDAERATREVVRAAGWNPAPKPAAAAWRYPTLADAADPKAPADKKDAEGRAEKVRMVVDDFWKKVRVKPPKAEDLVEARNGMAGMTDAGGSVVRGVWARLLADPAPAEALVKEVSLLVDAVRAREPVTTEQVLLRRLAGVPDFERIEPEAVGRLLNAEAEAGRAISTAVGEAFPYVADRLQAADDLKSKAERTLFDPGSSGKSKDEAKEALKRAGAMFADVRDRAEAVLGVRAAVREALRLLTATAAAAGEDEKWWADWKKVAESVAEPVGKVFAPNAVDELPDNWRSMSFGLKRDGERLQARVDDVPKLAEKILGSKTPQDLDGDVLRSHVLALRTALLTSCLTARVRTDAWDAVDRGEAILHERVRALDAADDGKAYPDPPPASTPGRDGAARRRAEVSLTLARLAGLDVTRADALLRGTVGTDRTAWVALSDEMRRLWSEPGLAKAMAGPDAVGERATRSVAPPAAGLLQPEKSARNSPAERSGRSAATAADAWLEQHFRTYRMLRTNGEVFYLGQMEEAAQRARQ